MAPLACAAPRRGATTQLMRQSACLCWLAGVAFEAKDATPVLLLRDRPKLKLHPCAAPQRRLQQFFHDPRLRALFTFQVCGRSTHCAAWVPGSVTACLTAPTWLWHGLDWTCES